MNAQEQGKLSQWVIVFIVVGLACYGRVAAQQDMVNRFERRSRAGTSGADPAGRGQDVQAGMDQGKAHPSRVLVRFKPGTSAEAKRAAHHAARSPKTLREFRAVSGLTLVEVPEGRVDAAVKAYRDDPNVLYAEPDYVVYATAVPNDPDFDLLWGLHNTGQMVEGDPGTPGADIRAGEAWSVWTGDPDFRIAVIDTGIYFPHPDLAYNIWTNPGEHVGDANGDGCPGVCGVDDDGDGLIDEDSQRRRPGDVGYSNDLVNDDDENGWVDDFHGYDFRNDDNDPADDDSHGSHVSGTIGAVGNNSRGVTGVNWRCNLVVLKFLAGP